VFLIEMLNLYRKNEACETRQRDRKKEETQNVKQQRDGGGIRHTKRESMIWIQ